MNDRNHMRPSRWAVDRMNEEMEPGKVTPTPEDETRKRLWVDVFYRGLNTATVAYDPRSDEDRVTGAASLADLAVAEYDQRFGA